MKILNRQIRKKKQKDDYPKDKKQYIFSYNS